MSRITCSVGLALLFSVAVSAQDFGDLIAPSSDELSEAQAQGEIDAEQFRILRDFYHLGISANAHWLLDEIPTMSGDSAPATQEPTWRAIRWRALQSGGSIVKGKTVLIRQRWQRRVEPDEAEGYRTTFGARLNNNWAFRGAWRRELNGTRTAVGRSLVYRGNGMLQQAIFGNFNSRMGLGIAYGFRGQLLTKRPAQTGDSWLYPISGGGNGVALDLAHAQEKLHILGSSHRDTVYGLTSIAGALRTARLPLEPELIWTVNRIGNRLIHRHQTVTSWGLHLQKQRGQWRWEAEAGHQRTGHADAGAAVFETSWKDGETRLNGAGWWYGRDFVDLSSGGKSANLSTEESLDDVSFTYRTRRSGQKGLMLKTVTQPRPRVELTTAGLVGAVDQDSLLAQLQAECLIDKQAQTSYGLSYFGRFRRLMNNSGSGEENRHEPRAELFFRRAGAEFRSYIGWREQTGRGGSLRSLMQARWLPEPTIALELWWQVAQTSHNGIDSWYGYIQLNQQWGTVVRSAAKLSDSWLRSRAERHRVTFALELTVIV